MTQELKYHSSQIYQIFTHITDFEFDQIDTRLKETSFLNAGLEIVITDKRGEDEPCQ